MENMTLHWLPLWHFISIYTVCSLVSEGSKFYSGLSNYLC